MDTNAGGRSVELQIAYAEDLNQGLLKVSMQCKQCKHSADILPSVVTFELCRPLWHATGNVY